MAIAGVPFKCPAAPFEARSSHNPARYDRYATGTVQIRHVHADPLPVPLRVPRSAGFGISMLQSHGVGFPSLARLAQNLMGHQGLIRW